ncbi:MAG TPA: DUF6498-containing protein [Casimicrobiaceae bacterium]|nr:DUF6498-containing protein [Casimicrobiaceae bacterium]
MNVPISPPAIASIVARNVVPVAGVLFLGWLAPNLMVLYYIDTILAFAVVVLLIARHVTGMGKPDERGRPLEGPFDWIKTGLGALLGSLLICLPLGVPLFMLLAEFDWSVSSALADRSFVTGLVLQIAASASGCVQAHRDLLARDDDERVLKHRAAFIVARWLVVAVSAPLTGFFGFLGPRLGGALIVLVYAGGTIYFELFPDRALRWLNPKEARADADQDAARKARGGR